MSNAVRISTADTQLLRCMQLLAIFYDNTTEIVMSDIEIFAPSGLRASQPPPPLPGIYLFTGHFSGHWIPLAFASKKLTLDQRKGVKRLTMQQ